MKSRTQISGSDSGFTLLEIIVTILLGSILAALMMQFMGTALISSSRPVDIVRDNSVMEALMEKIISEYVEKINNNSATPLQNIKSGYAGDSNVTMDFIEFQSDGTENNLGATPTNSLKVTVQAAGHRLTTLLTKSRAKTDDPLSNY